MGAASLHDALLGQPDSQGRVVLELCLVMSFLRGCDLRSSTWPLVPAAVFEVMRRDATLKFYNLTRATWASSTTWHHFPTGAQLLNRSLALNRALL